MQRTPRPRRYRMDGGTVPVSLRLSRDLAEALDEVARSEYRDNRSAVIEQAVIEFLNRRNDRRVA